MANYVSKYTGAQVDEAVGKALNPSYNDLTDKPFYEEQGKVLLNCVPFSGERYETPPFLPEFGKTYIITTDSGTELVECLDNGSNYVFVNSASIRAYYRCRKDGTAWEACDANGGNTFVVREAPVIHPIEPKFIPGAVLPVVEFTTVIPEYSDYWTGFTEEENARLTELAQAQTPFVAKATHYDGRISINLMSLAIYVDGTMIYSGAVSNDSNVRYGVEIRCVDGVWEFFAYGHP